jgi:sarcosine oxidase subunit gamma
MYDPVRQESPLARFEAEAGDRPRPEAPGVRLFERPFRGHVNLRGNTGDAVFLNAVAGVLGFGLPVAPNTFFEDASLTALWLGPDEWLIVTPPGGESTIAFALKDALGGTFSSVTDVTGGQTVVRISGPRARDVLAKGCTLDLHPREFGPGRCAQTLLAKAMVTVMQVDDSPAFDLIVRRTFADYLAHWLRDAAAEFGLEEAP